MLGSDTHTPSDAAFNHHVTDGPGRLNRLLCCYHSLLAHQLPRYWQPGEAEDSSSFKLSVERPRLFDSRWAVKGEAENQESFHSVQPRGKREMSAAGR